MIGANRKKENVMFNSDIVEVFLMLVCAVVAVSLALLISGSMVLSRKVFSKRVFSKRLRRKRKSKKDVSPEKVKSEKVKEVAIRWPLPVIKNLYVT